jgi:hypothetical protein
MAVQEELARRIESPVLAFGRFKNEGGGEGIGAGALQLLIAIPLSVVFALLFAGIFGLGGVKGMGIVVIGGGLLVGFGIAQQIVARVTRKAKGLPVNVLLAVNATSVYAFCWDIGWVTPIALRHQVGVWNRASVKATASPSENQGMRLEIVLPEHGTVTLAEDRDRAEKGEDVPALVRLLSASPGEGPV